MDDQSRDGWKRAFAAAAWALAASLPILVAVMTTSVSTAIPVVWLLGLLGYWFWRERRAGRPLLDAAGLAVLALAPPLLLAWLQDGWGGPRRGSPRVSVLACSIAAAVVSASLVRAVGRRDGALSIAGAIFAPLALTLCSLGPLLEMGHPEWLAVAPLTLAVMLALTALVLRRRWAVGALPLLGLAALVLLPALALCAFDIDYNFNEWPCSSMNVHLRMHPWSRMIVHATSLGLLVAAGGEVLRRRSWRLVVALTVGSLLVQVPASYIAYRSGCGGEIGQGLVGWTRQEDPRESKEGYCDVRFDWLGRAELPRADQAPLQIMVPVWLLDASRAGLRAFLLAHREPGPLPVERCRR